MSLAGNATVNALPFVPAQPAPRRIERRQRIAVVLSLLGLAVASTMLRVLLLGEVRAPWTFMDELEYEKLAETIGFTGHPSLFSHGGFTLPPLYPLILAPVYALHLSLVRAYEVVKVVNAGVMSLSVLPLYGIGRVILPRRWAFGVCAVMTFAPLMYYPALVMSENVAYPLFLIAAWALMRTLLHPSARRDVAVVASIAAACSARLEFVVLLPAAFSAIGMAGAFDASQGSRLSNRLKRSFAAHPLLLWVTVLLVVSAAGLAAKARGGLPLGVYRGVLRSDPPGLGHLLELFVEHLAELNLALGVLPFIGTLVAGSMLIRRRGASVTAFSAVAASLTLWLVFEVAYGSSSVFTNSGLERLHERYLIYVCPFFVIASFAAIRLRPAAVSLRTEISAVVVSALVPLLIPFKAVVNGTIAADTWGLLLYAKSGGPDAIDHSIVAVPNAVAVAVSAATLLGLIYLLSRGRPMVFVVALFIVFAFLTALVRARVVATSRANAVTLRQQGWVDGHAYGRTAILVTDIPHGLLNYEAASRRVAFLQTAFYSAAIDRVYFACAPVFGPEFGEQQVSVGHDGVVRDTAGVVHASLAVVPTSFHIRGRIVAREATGRLALVEPVGGVLAVPTGARLC